MILPFFEKATYTCFPLLNSVSRTVGRAVERHSTHSRKGKKVLKYRVDLFDEMCYNTKNIKVNLMQLFRDKKPRGGNVWKI